MSVLHGDVQMDQKNSQEYKSLEIYAVTITEYLWLNITTNGQAHHLL